MKEIVSVAMMRLSDENTIASGISGIELMQRAAMGVYSSVNWHGKIAIVCGSGNNGVGRTATHCAGNSRYGGALAYDGHYANGSGKTNYRQGFGGS